MRGISVACRLENARKELNGSQKAVLGELFPFNGPVLLCRLPAATPAASARPLPPATASSHAGTITRRSQLFRVAIIMARVISSAMTQFAASRRAIFQSRGLSFRRIPP